MRYGCVLSQAFSSWYFSWTSSDPHRSDFKLHTAVLSVLCVMFQCVAVFCNESIECFPGTAFKFFLKFLVTIPVARIITGVIVHFRFHIRCISIHKLLYFNFFSAFFCGYCHIYQCAYFLFFVFNYYMWPIWCNFSVCVYCLVPQYCDISLFIHRLEHVCAPFICGLNA